MTQPHIDALKRGDMHFNDFLSMGLIEYLDVNEENNALVALYESQCHAQARIDGTAKGGCGGYGVLTVLLV